MILLVNAFIFFLFQIFYFSIFFNYFTNFIHAIKPTKTFFYQSLWGCIIAIAKPHGVFLFTSIWIDFFSIVFLTITDQN